MHFFLAICIFSYNMHFSCNTHFFLQYAFFPAICMFSYNMHFFLQYAYFPAICMFSYNLHDFPGCKSTHLAASCSSFSCRMSSSRRASSRSCSAFSRRSQALLMSCIMRPSRGVYGFWLAARMRDCKVNSRTSRLPFSTNL